MKKILAIVLLLTVILPLSSVALASEIGRASCRERV